jgi:hypothetical protein
MLSCALFEPRSHQRKILAYLATPSYRGRDRRAFDISNRGLATPRARDAVVTRDKRGQFVHYRWSDNLSNTLNGYLQQVCRLSPLKRESKARPRAKVSSARCSAATRIVPRFRAIACGASDPRRRP